MGFDCKCGEGWFDANKSGEKTGRSCYQCCSAIKYRLGGTELNCVHSVTFESGKFAYDCRKQVQIYGKPYIGWIRAFQGTMTELLEDRRVF